MADAHRSALTSAIFYQDRRAALAWLEQAFGFEPFMVLIDAEGEVAHAEMRFGDGLIMVGSEWSAMRKSPKSIGGFSTQSVHVRLEADIDAHFARATAAGAIVEQAPETQFYGDRTYRVFDPEGHVWTFSQTVQVMSDQEAAAAGAMTVQTSL